MATAGPHARHLWAGGLGRVTHQIGNTEAESRQPTTDHAPAQCDSVGPGQAMTGMQRRQALAILAGVAVAWPLAGRAQQKVIRVIAFLTAPHPSGTSKRRGHCRAHFGRASAKPATSKAKTGRPNTATPTAITIGCLQWPPT